MKKIILVLILIILTVAIIVIGAVVFSLKSFNNKIMAINSFEECVLAGYPIMESYPEQCKTPDGKNFIRTVKPAESSFDNSIIMLIGDNANFSDGLSITLLKIDDSRCKQGVVCFWAGELSPRFIITGGDIGQTAQEFSLGTTTKNTETISGYIFTLDDATENTITITVSREAAKIGPSNSQSGCYVGGCSGQVCSDKGSVASTCEYKEEYACYKTAKCERQADNQCGWTQTTELAACLREK